jgi:hypothetical protein
VARRLEWAIKQHRYLAADDLDELHAEFKVFIGQFKVAYEQKYDQKQISKML